MINFIFSYFYFTFYFWYFLEPVCSLMYEIKPSV